MSCSHQSTFPAGSPSISHRSRQHQHQSTSKTDILFTRDQNFIDLTDPNELVIRDNPHHTFPSLEGDRLDAEIKLVQRALSSSPLPSPPHPKSLLPSSHSINQKKIRPQKPPPLVVASYGHDPRRVQQINEDNTRIARKLYQFANAPLRIKSTTAEHDKYLSNCMASLLAQRQKQEDILAKDNISLYKKLQAVTASEVVNRKILKDQYDATRKYMPKIKRAGPIQAPPGVEAPKSEWDDRWHIPAILHGDVNRRNSLI